ncbi:MAG: hypothetical protein R6U29_01600 [Desulfosudaceae bacterium]
MPRQTETRNEVSILYMENGAENALNSEMVSRFNASLDEDLRYIDEEMDVTMFKDCDLSCLRELA